MDYGDEKFVEARRIRYADDEVEAGTRPRLHRRMSASSDNMSISSMHTSRSRTRRASIDPANAIPIEYRTL